MKKINYFIFFLLATLLIIFSFTLVLNKEEVSDIFVLKQDYVLNYEKDEVFQVYLYSNSKLDYLFSDYYNEYSIHSDSKDIYMKVYFKDFYYDGIKYKVNFYIPDIGNKLYIEDCKMTIINQNFKYEFQIGNISIEYNKGEYYPNNNFIYRFDYVDNRLNRLINIEVMDDNITLAFPPNIRYLKDGNVYNLYYDYVVTGIYLNIIFFDEKLITFYRIFDLNFIKEDYVSYIGLVLKYA
ncbi:MAG: hypothetical protein ACRC5M_02260 [Anaeroplasmataceae bacterium]